MFEVIDKIIAENTKITENDKDVKAVVKLFDSISEGEIPPQFAKYVKGGDDKKDDDEDDKNEDDKKEDDKKEDEVKEESTRKLIKYFDSISEGDQERLDKSDDAKKGEDNRSGEEQPAKGEKSGSPKEGASGEVDSESGVKKDTEDALVDWVFCTMVEAEDLTQDHQVHKQGLRGAIGNANDGDGNKDDALPDTDDKEANPENAKKLVDKSGDVNKENVEVIQDWLKSIIN